LITLFVGCTDNFEDFNTDKKNPAVVSGNALFSNGQKELSDQVNQTNVNQNIWKLWAQYWTETTYTDEANYDIVTRNIPEQIYRYYFREGALKDMHEAARLIAEETSVEGMATMQNRLYIIDILKVYCFHQLVDIFGMIPYTDALDIENVYPRYEDGATVYNALFAELDAAIAGLNPAEESFGSADLYYGGDVSAWVKFANTLKIKMAITISDANAAQAKAAVEAALPGAFESSDDDCLMPYQTASPNQNPLYEEIISTGRKDFVAANTIIDMMNGLDDPRRASYFEMIDTSGSGDFVYYGGQYGYSAPYAQYSHIHPDILAPDFPGFILTYTELLFYLAEAAERGITVPNSAEEYYNMGIENSILEWGGSEADADDYLAQASVAYATAEGDWKQKIGTQSWIAAYTRGLEGYTTWRRLDYPVFNIAQQISSTAEIPTRFSFPIQEQTLNPDNYTAAAAAMGGDALTAKIFWDINDAIPNPEE
jgi:hypothetical protein